jgi:hypothetical protein
MGAKVSVVPRQSFSLWRHLSKLVDSLLALGFRKVPESKNMITVILLTVTPKLKRGGNSFRFSATFGHRAGIKMYM